MNLRAAGGWLGLIAFGLQACAPSEAATETPPPPAPPSIAQIDIAPPAFSRPEDTTFGDVLAEYQALNQRLSRVAAPLRLRNAALCPRTRRDPGFSTHRLEDYPPPLRPVAQDYLNLEPGGVHIRAVRAQTSADTAALQAGDRILAVNTAEISADPGMSVYNRAVLRNGFDSVMSRVRVRTVAGREFVARIRPATACDIPVKVVHANTVNGHTDGRDVLITSALMRAVPDDTHLALIVAHEMGHIIAGHSVQSQAIELEADRMALVLMTRAGYDPRAVVEDWADAPHPHEGGTAAGSSHPTTQARYENFRKELARIDGIAVEELGFGE